MGLKRVEVVIHEGSAGRLESFVLLRHLLFLRAIRVWFCHDLVKPLPLIISVVGEPHAAYGAAKVRVIR